MENINFGRSYKITFGKPEIQTSAYITQGAVVGKLPAPDIEHSAVTIPAGDIVSISNLISEGNDQRGFFFKFNSIRGASSSSSKKERTTLSLYNLNDESIGILHQEGVRVIIEAGYDDVTNVVYAGEVVSILPKTEGQDQIQFITLKDGYSDIKNTRVSLDIDESLSAEDALKALVSTFPTASIGNFSSETLKNTFITGGFNFYGRTELLINKFCERYGLVWSRFNGVISVTEEQLVQGTPSYLLAERNTFTIDADNIKNIDASTSNKGKLSDQKNVKRGVTLYTFLLPIRLDQFFTVPEEASKEFAGTYKITSIGTNLDSRLGPWDTVLKGEPL